MPSLTKLLSQRDLYNALLEIFPGKRILNNVKKQANVFSNGHFLELDIWIPELKLAFEFQDSYHYSHVWYRNEQQTGIQNRDNSKETILKERGETLVIVPCWWNGDIESLKATIQSTYPKFFDFPLKSPPIPSHPPDGFFSANVIPDIGNFMLATFPSSTNHIDNWWVSEKYDGIRTLWQHNKQTFHLRSAREIVVPHFIAKHFPKLLLDSELWFGRKSFSKCQRFISDPSRHYDWFHLRCISFDYFHPSHVFEKRFETLLSCGNSNPIITIPPNIQFSNSLLEPILLRVTSNFGEGLVARKPESLYQTTRSEDLVKFKVKRELEALVTNLSKVDADLSLPNGKRFVLQLTAKERKRLNSGDIVTLSYDNISSLGVPLGAKMLRVRKDIAWERDSETPHQTLTGPTISVMYSMHHARGHWTSDDGSNIAEFFDSVAKKKGLDPHNPRSWYNVTQQDIAAMPGGSSILSHYGGSFIKGLLDVYPNIGLDITKFTTMPKRFWQERDNMVFFFNKYAETKGFDPLIAAHWYGTSKESIKSIKGGESILKACKGSYIKLLMSLYPKIGLEEDQFRKGKRGYTIEVT